MFCIAINRPDYLETTAAGTYDDSVTASWLEWRFVRRAFDFRLTFSLYLLLVRETTYGDSRALSDRGTSMLASRSTSTHTRAAMSLRADI